MTNTRISYSYVDAENRRSFRDIIIEGDVAGPLLAALSARGNYDILKSEKPAFIPGQLGLPDAHDHFELLRDWNFQIDHPWQTLDLLEATDEPATAPTILASEVLRRAQSVDWDNNHTPWFKDFLDARLSLAEQAASGKWTVIDENIDGYSRYVMMNAEPTILTVFDQGNGELAVRSDLLQFDDGRLEAWLDTIECDLFSDCICRGDGDKIYGEEAIKLMIEAAYESGATDDTGHSFYKMEDVLREHSSIADFVRSRILGEPASTGNDLDASV